MTPVVIATVVALMTAAAVLVLSVVVAGVGRAASPRQLLADFRAGLRPVDEGRTVPERFLGDLGDPDDPDEGSVDDVFVVGRPDPVGYVDPDEITAALGRARDAVRGIAHLPRR
jgi:hypothetical protein